MRRDVRLLITTGIAAVGAGLVVAILVISAAGGPKTAQETEPVEVGTVANLERQIREGGPVLFPDLARGDRAFYVTLVDGKLAALHAYAPGQGTTCSVEWNRKERRFEDCKARPVDPHTLGRLALTTEGGSNDPVVVDPRLLSPAGPTGASGPTGPTPGSLPFDPE